MLELNSKSAFEIAPHSKIVASSIYMKIETNTVATILFYQIVKKICVLDDTRFFLATQTAVLTFKNTIDVLQSCTKFFSRHRRENKL